MKKFIIGFMCVILLSCHPVAASFASVQEWQVTTQTTNTDEELYLCKDISAFAYVAMQAHQNGVSEEAQLSLAPVPTTQDEAVLKVLLDGIIHDAMIAQAGINRVVYKEEYRDVSGIALLKEHGVIVEQLIDNG